MYKLKFFLTLFSFISIFAVQAQEQAQSKPANPYLLLSDSNENLEEPPQVNSAPPMQPMAVPPGGGGEAGSQFSSDELYQLSLDGFGVQNTGLFGEQHDLYTGEVWFEHADVEINTNLGVPISVKRSTGYNKEGRYRVFGNWNLNIPSLYSPVSGNYMYGASVCDAFWSSSRYIPGSMEAGDALYTPHLGGLPTSRGSLLHDGSISAPANTLLVNQDNWAITCENNVYKAVSPQGITYTFGQLVQYKSNSNQPSTTLSSDGFRGYSMVMVTRISDRFGKFINFNYQNGLIQSIVSSDGSQVNFSYNSNYLISSINANGRVWTYSYSGNGLTGVNLPDGKSWSFNLGGINSAPSTSTPTVYATITHPYGAVGNFTAQRIRHGRSLVPTVKGGDNKNLLQTYEDFNSLVSKTISGPGLPTMQWNYTYSANSGGYVGTNVSDLRTVRVDNPDGRIETYSFYRTYDWRGGKIFKKEVSNASGLLESQVNTWVKGNKIGQAEGINAFSDGSNGRTLLSKSVTSRGTDSFTSEYSSYDSWGNPGLTTSSSSVSAAKKYISQTYFNDLSRWLIGLQGESKISADNATFHSVERTTYYPSGSNASLPQYIYKFGRLNTTYTSYFTSGTSAGMPQYIAFNGRGYASIGGYKNSIPLTVTKPSSDGSSSIQANLTVDANGWVSAFKDFNGNTTNFGYNQLGWRTLIAPADTQWNQTSIDYASVSGFMTKTTSKGNYRKVEKFDGFLRRILSEEYDSTNVGQKVVQRFEYDSENRPTFESFPAVANPAYGISTSYDVLGRTVSVVDTSNNALTQFQYLNGHRITETDPKGHVTNSYYESFGSPDYEQVIRIAGPASSQTTLTYTPVGALASATQGGITEYRVYSAYQDLCKVVRPDVGNTGFSYNSLGQLQWKASGASIDSATTSCDTSADSSDMVSYSYDSRANLKLASYSDTALNNTLSYDANDNLLSSNTGAVSKVWGYNSLNQKTSQRLTVDGLEFLLSYGYDANGYLSRITYPDGEVVNYQPNALGQAKQVGSYVSQVSYHPTGLVKGFSYGNGYIRASSLHNNGALARLTDTRSGVLALDQSLTYDLNQNISQLTDHVSTIYSLSLSYDGLDRLTGFSSQQIGAGQVGYDVLGNITQLKHGAEQLTYSYSSNRLSAVTGSNNFSFSYDSRGNVTHNGQYGLTFNTAGQLKYAKGNEYLYDGEGIRIKSLEAQGISYFVHGVDGKLLYKSKSGVAEKFYHLNGALVAKKAGSVVSYIHSDYLGSPAANSNAAGGVVSRQYYRPFGGTISQATDDIGYTGHKYDTELGLNYMQQRYYDPVIGRFYSNDPVGFTADKPMMFNRYAYANNNPYKYTDPDGRSALVLEGIKDGAIIGGSAGGPWGAAGGAIVGGLIGAGATYGIIQLANESSNDVDDFVDDLKGKSEPDKNSGKGKIRTLTDGTSVDEAFDSFPGKEGEASDGSKIKTGSDGSTAHIHNSSKDNGRKTLNIKRPDEKKPTKFREPEKKND